MKKFLSSLFIFLNLPALVFGATAFLSTSQGSSTTSFSFNHTRHASANVLIVGCNADENSRPVSATYAGNAMAIVQDTIPTSANSRTTLHFLASPPSGTNSVAISRGGAEEVICFAADFSGAALTTPSSPQGAFQDVATTVVSVTVTCAAGGLAVSVFGSTSTSAPTPSGTRVGTAISLSSSTAAFQYRAGAGATVMSETVGSESMSIAGACIEAGVAAPPTFARPAIIVQ